MEMNTRTIVAALILFVLLPAQIAMGAAAEKKLRVVIFGAHCDDPETGAGGLVAQLTQTGHEVILAYAATFRGDRQIDGEPEDTVRRRESAAACAILGATPYFFPYDMATLNNDAATAKQFNDWLAEVKPDIVLAHWPLDTHPNHQVVGALAWQAYRHEGGWSLYYFEVLTNTQSMSFQPNVYVDIAPVADMKKKAIDCLVSQDPAELWQLHDAMHLARGKECGCERAEAYFLVEAKSGAALLPVSARTCPEKNPAALHRQAENLDRGLVAMPLENGRVYLGWRLFTHDFPGLAFNVYRAVGDEPGVKLNDAPIEKTTDYIDETAPAGKDKTYWLEPLLYKMPQGISKPVAVQADAAPSPYRAIKLDGDYTVQKVGIGDLDGDGTYDFVIKQPDLNVDPGNTYWSRSTDTYKIEAYLHDGTLLWRKDLGWSIEQGIWYSPYVVYDFDGDGRAEIAVKTGEGDPRSEDGRVRESPEYLSIWDGMTGEEITRTPWLPRLEVYKLSSRNQLGVAFLDGRTPHIVMTRGTYEDMHAATFRFRNGVLERVWDWSNVGEPKEYFGQGAHFMHCADVDGDTRDEVILGSCALDDNGKSLWTTGLGHPDHAYLGEIDPAHPGLEVYYGVEGERVEREKDGTCLVDAGTGVQLWGLAEHTWHVHGSGLCADIDSRYPGLECYSGEVEMPKEKPRRWLHAASGEIVAREDTCDLGTTARSAYWDADLTKELIAGTRIYKFESGVACLESLEGSQVAWADITGDWREEIITSVPGELRIYETTIPAADRRPCLMEDPLYRQDVAHLSMGYAQPPMLSYWIAVRASTQ